MLSLRSRGHSILRRFVFIQTYPSRFQTSAASKASDRESNSNPYPYPTHTNPRPHQIFHLPHNASQNDVKRRYYDLVRIYHPDSPVARHYAPEVSQARFQSITQAYDMLRGKSAFSEETLASRTANIRHSDIWRGRSSRRPHFDDTSGDERWKERTIAAVVILTLVAFVVQTMTTRQQALAEIVARSQRKPHDIKGTQEDHTLGEDSKTT
ncbi:hypothetical protein SERLA73DRAFT_180287 [Serpula lacrymans var. lacrymans S7.3]|uniref:J domain-containing protein n=2 Tax=Serpula lacrymans var. lacrymans TaxID=341189 RepID=F8PWE9_SERL3|nr:uncharacterized protein SERLADRAFT_465800 [Serpula lacrymans var. lacrymans S7.9]EGN99954.1 hypothetical protein SERLA73DRAFT_180287 [Serpula lacrymans var. lacrymans S7.3]EGO25518.1 hypothetical protein SERLADRAFT_465800 [Serpula lacrymans var. lacrymans S7.9]